MPAHPWIKQGKRLFSCAISLLLVLLSALPSPVSADGLETLQSQQAALQEQQAEIQAELEALREQQMSALQQKVLLDQQMNLTVAEINLVNEQISAYEVRIQETRVQLEQHRQVEAEQLAVYRTRLRAMEEAGEITYYQIVFGASDFEDLLSRIDCIAEIMECDANMYRELSDARLAVQRGEEVLLLELASLESKRQELETLRQQQAETVAEATAIYRAIEEDLETWQLYAAEIEAEEAEVQAQISAIYAAMAPPATPAPTPTPVPEDAPDDEEDAPPAATPTPAPQAPATGGGEGFLWPTATTTVNSNFGNRLHPILGEWRLHTGIDIGAGYGEPVMAAKSGEIAFAGEEEGYGNYVVIYHDDGTITLYAHMSEIWCYGGRVSQGQTIGLVGATGYAEVAHLHFEILVDGGYVDPLLYLP